MEEVPEQKSEPITLTKGMVIYVEALMKEGAEVTTSPSRAPVGQEPQYIKQEYVNVYRAYNEAPKAEDDEATTPQAKEVTIDVLANDSDADDDDIYIQWVSESEEGVTLTENDDGTLTYEPPSGFSGDDYFKYTLADGHGGTAQATVMVRVKKAFPDEDLNSNPTDDTGNGNSSTDVGGTGGPGPAGTSDGGCVLPNPPCPIRLHWR